MGIDLGSVSLNVVIIDDEGEIKASKYTRTEGRPLPVLLGLLEELGTDFDSFEGIIATGSGRKLVAKILGVPDINEIVAHATAACHFYPNAHTIIEIGGQDSKLIYIDQDPKTGEPVIIDHVLNDVCAAGTGSFLDLQAQRLGMTIEDLGGLALCSDHPARISGRCSVFAKSDMVHLLQEGTQKADIVAGLCYALTRNFITNLGKGKSFLKPIIFQGGVAANPAVVDAFEDLLGVKPGSLIIPEHFLVMGAFGSALIVRNGTNGSNQSMSCLIECIRDALEEEAIRSAQTDHLRPLGPRKGNGETEDQYYGIRLGDGREAFMGIDIGAVSTNLVLVDRQGQLMAKQYWYTQGEPVDTVRAGLEEMARRIGDGMQICGVGVTGSGRYFIGDFVGADVVINEITAQARAAVHLDPAVDTIIEIGGQDSKYIRCKDGRVIDFEMNKVCAAGTGSFLEEQGARLKVEIRKGFSDLAFSSNAPVDLGARCTVFMESDLVHHQQKGKSIGDLTAGLSYAIAHNYLEKVVGTKKIGNHILFQGGVAGNQSVASAFENILGRPLHTPRHHNVTGALGAALAARDAEPSSSQFAGFHLKDRPYEMRTFECHKCPNLCSIHQIYIEGTLRAYYGSLCGRYEKTSKHSDYAHLPDLFEERQSRLFEGFDEAKGAQEESGQVIGIPRTLSFFDYFPFWHAFFKTLGHPVVLSEGTNKTLLQGGLPYIQSETCFPIKTVYGHVRDLMSKGVDQILLPCEIDHPETAENELRSFNCPYIQSMPYMIQAAMGSKVNLLAPTIRWSLPRRKLDRVLLGLGRSLGNSAARTKEAIAAGREALRRFDKWRQERGKAILDSIGQGERCLVLLGKSHNIFDAGLNLHLARKLRLEGQVVLPFDMLPLEGRTIPGQYDNVVWKNTRDLLKALLWMRNDERLFPVLLTNFGCGPDSFFIKYMEAELTERPYLILEVDEHTGDAGIVTRIEAFLDTLDAAPKGPQPVPRPLNLTTRARRRAFDAWGPEPGIMGRLENRILYFPYVSAAFSLVFQAAFRSIGLEFRVLPEPDDESEYLGRQVTSGRECHPFVVTCGDFLKMTREPEFDPEHAAIFMLNYDGACRFSQYAIGHADLFRRLDMPQVPIIAPICSTRFDEFSGLFGLRFTAQLWQGLLASEALDRVRLHVRPYERGPGETDRVYERCIQDIARAVAKPSGMSSIWNRNINAALRRGVDALEAIPVDRSQGRPIIGIVGEFYTVLNRWANQDIIRTLERLGAEVKIHGLTVSNNFAMYSGHYYYRNRLKEGRLGSALYYFLRNQWVMSCIRHTEGSLNPRLRPFGTLGTKTMLRETEPFIHHDIDAILASFTTRVRRFAASGVSGICNLFVLNCMLGNITVPIFKNALRSYKNLPILNAVYDAQMETNMLTRIEAFMHQARLYRERQR